MSTPRDIITQNVRRSLANLATADLLYSTDQGSAWSSFVGNAVLHVDPPSLLGYDSEALAELEQQTATLKVSDDATSMPVDGWWIRQSGVTDRAWKVDGPATVHSGQRQFRLAARYLASGNQSGPDRGQLR